MGIPSARQSHPKKSGRNENRELLSTFYWQVILYLETKPLAYPIEGYGSAGYQNRAEISCGSTILMTIKAWAYSR